jgi:hypothetical protein
MTFKSKRWASSLKIVNFQQSKSCQTSLINLFSKIRTTNLTWHSRTIGSTFHLAIDDEILVRIEYRVTSSLHPCLEVFFSKYSTDEDNSHQDEHLLQENITYMPHNKVTSISFQSMIISHFFQHNQVFTSKWKNLSGLHNFIPIKYYKYRKDWPSESRYNVNVTSFDIVLLVINILTIGTDRFFFA